PRWMITVIAIVLLVPALVSHHQGKHDLAKLLSWIALAVVTLSMVASLGLLIAGLASKRQTPPELLLSAALLWLSNVLIFASWYWRLDAGGPHKRDLRAAHTGGAFLFPQMTLSGPLKHEICEQ